jgi:thiamine-monophosphate kinase
VPNHEPSEDALLGRIKQRFPGKPKQTPGSIRLGIGDDAALLAPRTGYRTILTCDWFLEGTHFLRNKHPADAVGWKCLARAVSDVAAMGGIPQCFLLSLALPETHIGQWLDDFLKGLRRASLRFKCELAGGDTTRRRETLIHVTVAGEIAVGRAVLRSGARPGDILYVSGKLGEAELGLRRLRNLRKLAGKLAGNKDQALYKHLFPEPRLTLGRWLMEKRLATAMMDLSDGLSSDLPRLCSASGVGARVEATRIPAAQVTRQERDRGIEPLSLALHGGDDYELLFTVPKRKAKSLPRSMQGVPLTAIGEITRDPRLLLVDAHGHASSFHAGGWDPFRAPAKRKPRRQPA